MRAVPAVLLLGCALLAGCVEGPEGGGGDGDGTAPPGSGPASDRCGPRPDEERLGKDWSKETLRVSVTSPGAFRADLPLPVSPDGTQPADWLANAQLPEGWTAVLQATPDGQQMRLGGSGDGVVVSCSLQPQSGKGNGCCAEQYLDARWTGTGQSRAEMEALPVQVLDGRLGIEVGYTALSNWCGAEAGFAGQADGAGERHLAGGHQAWCS